MPTSPLTRARLRELRGAVAPERRLAAVSSARIAIALVLTVFALATALVIGGRTRWLAMCAPLLPMAVAAGRLRLEPRKRRVGYICPACGGTFPTDADDFRLILRGGRCLRCGQAVLADPDLPAGTHRLPPMTALGEP